MDTRLLPGMDGSRLDDLKRKVDGLAASPGDAGRPPRIQCAERGQRFWEDTCLDERLPADHAARLVWSVVERLDLSAFYALLRARGSEPGRAAIDPRILVALWLYAAVEGIGNGRKLDRLCREQDGYRWLCGGVSVNYHTLNDFRVGHERALDQLLTDVLTALVAHDVVKVERISQDGKRIRASAGSSSFHRRETLEQLRAQAAEHVEQLKRQGEEESGQAARRRSAAAEKLKRLDQAVALLPELEAARENPRNNKKDRAKPVRVSSSDPAARKMKMADGGIRPAYNLQLAVDVSSGAIVGVEIGQSSNDGKYSESLRAQVQERTGRQVKEHLADQGYVDMKEIDTAETAGVAMYVPLPKGKDGCPVTASRWDTPGTRRWRARMQTPAAAEIYKQRFPASERVNAELQERLGLRRFAVRGLNRVRCVALWTALAFNLLHFALEYLKVAGSA